MHAHDDDVAIFFNNNAQEMLEMLFLANAESPSDVNKLSNRFMKPDFFNNKIEGRFPQIRNVEAEGRHHDWEVFENRISKKQQAGFFPRPYKKRPNKATKGTPVQLVNTHTKKTIVSRDHFDYLLLLETPAPGEPPVYSLSLMTIDVVIATLKEQADGGQNGGGQIRFVPRIDQCCVHVVLSAHEINALRTKYAEHIAVPDSLRNEIFRSDWRRVIESQATLHARRAA